MTIRFFAGWLYVFATALLPAQDPAVTDPDKYKVILENVRTRVLDYQDHPGEKTTQHRHPDSLLYALSNFKRRLTFPDGKSVVMEFKTGDVMFIPAQTHIGENTGNTETHVLLVEYKGSHTTLKPTAPK
jgi:hypothetical protein